VTETGPGGSGHPRAGRLQACIGAGKERLEASRRTSRGVDAAFVVQHHDRTVGGNLLACAIAYRLFLWLLPLALVIAAVLGFIESSESGATEELGTDLALGRSVVTVVADAAQQAERSRWVILVMALVAMYSAGAAGAKTLTAVHGLVWGMPVRQPRRGPVGSATFTGAALATILLATGAQYLRREAPGLGLTAMLVIVVVYSAAWVGVSTVLPHGDAPWARLVPGALLLGVGTQLLHLVTVYYLAGKIHSASELYGGLGVAATVLLGLYLLARLIVAAAVMNATLAERAAVRARRTGAVDDAGRGADHAVAHGGRLALDKAGSLAGGEAPGPPSAQHVGQRRKDT
jgi:uncharacterized BrkB/YihY/UPF0761 family membrane protein